MKLFPLLFLLFLIACDSHTHCVVTYFNDAHDIAPIQDNLGERGGVARVKSIIDEIKRENPNVFVVFGGDLAGGTLFGGFYHGFPLVEAFNEIPVDLANFGQHDFDFGVDVTRQLVDSSRFQWFTSNLLQADSSVFHNLPAALKRKVNGISIAFIGLTDAMNTTSNNNIIQLDLIQAAKKAIQHIEETDVILAVTQTDLQTNEMLLQSCPQIDAILTEERSENRSKIDFAGKRPIISPCGNMGSIVRLDIYKKNGHIAIKTDVVAVDSTVQSDPDLLALQLRYQKNLDQKLSEIIAHSEVPLDAGINSNFRCRWGETNLGNVVTDAFREFHQSDIAVLNGGGLRANIPAGAITIKDMLAVLPFGNRVCVVEMTGEAILKMLEHGVSDVENRGGRFLQISGGRYVYDWSAPPDRRILKVYIQNKKINLIRKYIVALPDYILMGGDGFHIAGQIIVDPQHAPLDIEVVKNNIRDHVISGKLDRIVVLNKGEIVDR